ncbi:hypothetical protein D3C86_2243920 [compost metagenome]
MNLLRIFDVQILTFVILEVIVEVLVVLVIVIIDEQHPSNFILFTLSQMVASLPLRRSTGAVDGLA